MLGKLKLLGATLFTALSLTLTGCEKEHDNYVPIVYKLPPWYGLPKLPPKYDIKYVPRLHFPPEEPEESAVEELRSQRDVDRFKEENEKGMIDFYAEDCEACRETRPHVEAAATHEDYKGIIAIGAFDVGQDRIVFFREGGFFTPSFFFYQQGEKTPHSFVGNYGRDFLFLRLDELKIDRNPQVIHLMSYYSLEQLLLNSELPVMIKFYDPWSQESRDIMAPFERASTIDYYERITGAEAELTEVPEAFGPNGYNFEMIPAIIFFNGTYEYDRIEGICDQEALYTAIDLFLEYAHH